MRKFICLLAVLLLSACGDSNNNGLIDGTLKATLGELTFETAGKCGNIDSEDEFFFNSDTGIYTGKDADGDGIMVALSRLILGEDVSPTLQVDGISLEISVNGEIYSSPIMASALPGQESKQIWAKVADGLTGTDELVKSDDQFGNKYPISYEVSCK